MKMQCPVCGKWAQVIGYSNRVRCPDPKCRRKHGEEKEVSLSTPKAQLFDLSNDAFLENILKFQVQSNEDVKLLRKEKTFSRILQSPTHSGPSYKEKHRIPKAFCFAGKYKLPEGARISDISIFPNLPYQLLCVVATPIARHLVAYNLLNRQSEKILYSDELQNLVSKTVPQKRELAARLFITCFAFWNDNQILIGCSHGVIVIYDIKSKRCDDVIFCHVEEDVKQISILSDKRNAIVLFKPAVSGKDNFADLVLKVGIKNKPHKQDFIPGDIVCLSSISNMRAAFLAPANLARKQDGNLLRWFDFKSSDPWLDYKFVRTREPLSFKDWGSYGKTLGRFNPIKCVYVPNEDNIDIIILANAKGEILRLPSGKKTKPKSKGSKASHIFASKDTFFILDGHNVLHVYRYGKPPPKSRFFK